MALADVQILAQTASLSGIYGLDLLTVLIFAAPATLIDSGKPRLLDLQPSSSPASCSPA